MNSNQKPKKTSFIPHSIIDTIDVNLNRVRQPTSGINSVYRLSAKVVGSDAEIPMGVATFKTF